MGRQVIPAVRDFDSSPIRALGREREKMAEGQMRAARRQQRVKVQHYNSLTFTHGFAARPSSALRAASPTRKCAWEKRQSLRLLVSPLPIGERKGPIVRSAMGR